MAFMAAALPFIQAAGAVLGVISALSQGRQQQQAYQYNAAQERDQAAQAEENAQISEQNAAIARSDAAAQAKQSERENYLRLGAIRANQGKSGGAAGEGNVLDILGDTAAQGELEKQDILYQGELSARGQLNAASGYRRQGVGYERSAALDTSAASYARTASYYKAGSELLAGGVNSYTTYSKLKRG